MNVKPKHSQMSLNDIVSLCGRELMLLCYNRYVPAKAIYCFALS